MTVAQIDCGTAVSSPTKRGGLGGGALCIYSYAATHVIVDITGYHR